MPTVLSPDIDDQGLRDVTSAEMRSIFRQVDRYMKDLAKETDKLNRGVSFDAYKIDEAVKYINSGIASYERLAKEAERYNDYALNTEIIRFRESEKAFRAYNNFYKEQEEKRYRESIKEAINKAREEEQVRRDAEAALKRHYEETSGMYELIWSNIDNSMGEMEHAKEQLFKANEEYLNASNKIAKAIAAAKLKTELENLETIKEKTQQQIEVVKGSGQYKDEIKDYTDQIEQYTRTITVSSEYIAEELGEVGESVKRAGKTFKYEFKDIFDSLNLHLITKSITQGSESIIDTMSDVSRMRGQTYEEMSGTRRGLTSADSFGGYLGAGDIMQVYQMRNLTEEYLSDIASTVAMFEKETQVSNESLNGMLLWMQNSGVSRTRTTQVLDFLQGIRDNGVNTEEAVNFISENAALLQGNEEEYAAAFGALDTMGLTKAIGQMNSIIQTGGNLIATEDSGLMLLLQRAGYNSRDVQEAYNRGDFTDIAKMIVEGYEELGKSNPNYLYAQNYGFNQSDFNQLAMFSKENGLTTEKISNKMDEILDDTSTVASNSDTVGFVDALQKEGNKLSTTFAGEVVTNMEEFARNHPIVTSLTTETIGKIGGEWIKNILPKDLKGLKDVSSAMVGKFEGIFSGSSGGSSALAGLAGPIAAGIAAEGAIIAITTAITKANMEKQRSDLEFAKTAGVLLDKNATAEEKEAAWKDYYEMKKSGSLPGLGSSSEARRTLSEVEALESQRVVSEESGNQLSDFVKSGRADVENDSAFWRAVLGNNSFTNSELKSIKEGLKYSRSHGVSDDELMQQMLDMGYTREEAQQFLKGHFASDISPAYLAQLSVMSPGLVTGYLASRLAAPTNIQNDAEFRSIMQDVQSSNATGLYSVPYDGYIAELHRGERVLTANEAVKYTDTVDQSLVHSELSDILNKLDNKDFQKIVKDGFEYIGKKLAEANSRTSEAVPVSVPSRKSLTDMYLTNQWG